MSVKRSDGRLPVCGVDAHAGDDGDAAVAAGAGVVAATLGGADGAIDGGRRRRWRRPRESSVAGLEPTCSDHQREHGDRGDEERAAGRVGQEVLRELGKVRS